MIKFNINQLSSFRVTAILEDETGTPIAAASLTTLTLTLYDRVTNAIINSRSAQNILDANGVTVDSSGNLVWTGTPSDAPILNSARNSEQHIALFHYTWSAGAKGAYDAIILEVNRFPNTTYPDP